MTTTQETTTKKMSRNARSLIQSLTAMKVSLAYSWNTHQANRLCEWADELQTLRSVDAVTKQFWMAEGMLQASNLRQERMKLVQNLAAKVN